jgi:hypothetical protein
MPTELFTDTEKRLKEYAVIEIDFKTTNIAHGTKFIETMLVQTFKHEIKSMLTRVRNEYGHLDSNLRYFIQAILSSFDNTFDKLIAARDAYQKQLWARVSGYRQDEIDYMNRVIKQYTQATDKIRGKLATIDAALVRVGAEKGTRLTDEKRAKLRKGSRTALSKLRERRGTSESANSASPGSANSRYVTFRVPSGSSARRPPSSRRIKRKLGRRFTMRQERQERVATALQKRKPVEFHLPEEEDENESASGSYSPALEVDINALGPPAVGDTHTNTKYALKPIGVAGKLPLKPKKVKRGTIKRGTIHNNE